MSKEDKWVCADCIRDFDLKEYIQENGEDGHCSFSEKHTHNGEKVISLDKLWKKIKYDIDFFFEGIKDKIYIVNLDELWKLQTSELEKKEYVDKWTCQLSYFINHYEDTNQNIFYIEHIMRMITDNDQLIKALCSKTRIKFYRLKTFSIKGVSKLFIDKWKMFCYYVRHCNRFFFNYPKQKKPYHIINHNYVNPISVLYDIWDIIDINKNIILKELKNEQIVYRARQFDCHHDELVEREEMTPPPDEVAKSPNRMSPAGISYFYCAEDPKTAVAEVLNRNVYDMFVSEWILKGEKKVIDLRCFVDGRKKVYYQYTDGKSIILRYRSNKIDIPGIFSKQNKFIFDYLFVKSFAEDLIKCSSKGNELIDYIPTQVVAEFLKQQKIDEESIDGIAYYSCINRHTNYCFFWNYEETLFEGKICLHNIYKVCPYNGAKKIK
ncbi:MAG: RES family NAD+ phosphorylase [Spirochaetales bacterium]|nr:RES family NAD+ phosphorylase [Spirochaetales bacterium]